MWETLGDFVLWIVTTIINPLLRMADSHEFLGFTLLDWLVIFGLIEVSIAFIRRFWDSGTDR